MPTVTIQFEYITGAERLAFVTQLRQVAASAPDGAILVACEQVALRDGRGLPHEGSDLIVSTVRSLPWR
jgi:hypothetical protein